jgi:hypothetical protein
MRYKIHDFVKLKDYTRHGDWKRHAGETAMIMEMDESTYPYRIQWRDKTTSRTPEENIVILEDNIDWVINRCIQELGGD